jgi:ribonuclease HIII
VYVGFQATEGERLAREMRAARWMREKPPTNPYELLRAEAEGAEFILWRSGKLAYRGPRARALLEEFARGAGVVPEGGPTEVGSDEAGKGEWLGPMVVAAVALRPDARLGLRLDGVRDSKELSGAVRQRLAERVRAQAAAHEVVSIGPKRFNELWAEMHARGETLNDLLWWAHRRAMEHVLAEVRGDPAVLVVLDEFDRTRHARRMFEGILPPGARVEQRPRAEDALAVAAASVLARAERDAQVGKLQAQHGLDPSLTPEAARRDARAAEFAKLAWLKGEGATRTPP